MGIYIIKNIDSEFYSRKTGEWALILESEEGEFLEFWVTKRNHHGIKLMFSLAQELNKKFIICLKESSYKKLYTSYYYIDDSFEFEKPTKKLIAPEEVGILDELKD